MRIAITGHTKGIGQGLYTELSKEHTVDGFSRSNGYDISTEQDRLIEIVKDYDVFINNAHMGNHQVTLFTKLFSLWQNKDRTIVNIGSISKYLETHNNGLKVGPYAQSKINLNKQAIHKTLSGNKKCRIITVNPGFVHTDMSSHVKNTEMLKVDELVPIISYAISLPQHIEIGDIGIWRTF